MKDIRNIKQESLRINKQMKILCVIESNSWIEHHIVGTLKDAGHTVNVYYQNFVGEFFGRDRSDERLAKNLDLLELAKNLNQRSGLDLIFCYVYDDFLLPETARALAALDVPMVNYNVDMVNQWYRQTRTAKYFTRMLCAQRENMDQLARYNPQVLYFPMAGRVVREQPDLPCNFKPAAPVTFLGTPNIHRAAVLSRLHADGVPLAVYGKYWKEKRQASKSPGLEKTFRDIVHYGIPKLRSEGITGLSEAFIRRFTHRTSVLSCQLPESVIHGILPENCLDALFAESQINLGFTRMTGDDPDLRGKTHTKLRDFEVPLAGGFYLVERVPEYSELFKTGVEVETWETVAELSEKIRYYLDHIDKRNEIAVAGKRRAVADHTWEKRFSMLFADLGIA